MMIKAVYFDFDGTLADTSEAIVMTMQQSYLHFGLPVPTPESIRQTIGLHLAECCRIPGNLDDKTVEQMVPYYRSIFNDNAHDFTAIYPHVAETIGWLHDNGYRLAICTSRGAPSLDVILKARNIEFGFETRVTAVDGLEPKPSPHMVLTLLDRMGLTPDEVVVVGDTTFDIMMGNSAGCRTVAVTYGNHSREQLSAANPSYIIDSFDELPRIIASIDS